MKLPQKIIDANVILRFFMADEPRHYERVCAFMEALEFGSEDALLPDVIFAEVVWVLDKVYKVPRADIAIQFERVIGFMGVKTVFAKEVYRTALQSYAAGKADIQDCLLAALAAMIDAAVVTFDKTDFKKLVCRFGEP